MPQREHHPTVVLVIGAEHDPIGPYLVACGCHVISHVGRRRRRAGPAPSPHLVIMDLDVENLDPYGWSSTSPPSTRRDAPIVVVVSAPETMRPFAPTVTAASSASPRRRLATLPPSRAPPRDTPRDPAVSAAPSDGGGRSGAL